MFQRLFEYKCKISSWEIFSWPSAAFWFLLHKKRCVQTKSRIHHWYMFRILIRCSGTGILGYFTQNAPLCQKGRRFENKVKLWDKISNIGRWFTFSGVSVCRLGGGECSLAYKLLQWHCCCIFIPVVMK